VRHARFIHRAIVFLTLISLFGLTACSKKGEGRGITFWVAMGEEEAEATRTIAARFFVETGIPVEVTEIGFFEITTKLELAAPAGEGPDMVTISHTSTGALALMGLLSPLETTLINDAATRCPPALTNAFRYRGRLYGAPLTVESYGLVVNRDLLKAAGYPFESPGPKNWEEVFEIAGKLTTDENEDGQAEVYGFLTDPANLYFTFPFYDALGGYIFGSSGGVIVPEDIGFCTPGGISALDLVTSLTRRNGSRPLPLIPRGITYPIISDLFARGKVAMMIHGTYLIGYYRSAHIDVGYYPLPPFSDGRRGKPLSTLMGIGISNYSKNKEDALGFLAFFLENKNLRSYFESSGSMRVMADPAVYSTEDFDREPFLKTAVEIAKDSTPFPNDPAGDLVWDAVRDAATLSIEGKASPEDVLCDMQEMLKVVITEMKR